MRRRTLLKTGTATGALTLTAGCLGWVPGVGSDSDADGDTNNENGTGSTDTNTSDSNRTAGTNQTNTTETDTNTSENTTTDTGTTENTDTGPSSVGEGDETNATETPTNDTNTTDTNTTPDGMGSRDYERVDADLTVSTTRFGTNQYGARLQGRITNNGDETITVVDVAVRFLDENADPINNEPKYDGTRGLTAGSSWSFDISARGSEYSSASDYELKVIAEEPALARLVWRR